MRGGLPAKDRAHTAHRDGLPAKDRAHSARRDGLPAKHTNPGFPLTLHLLIISYFLFSPFASHPQTFALGKKKKTGTALSLGITRMLASRGALQPHSF